MAIDATITHVAPTDDGGFELWVTARDPRSGSAGQIRLVVEGPAINRPHDGWELWGGDMVIMLGDEQIYERIGLTRLRECSTTAEAIRVYDHARPQNTHSPDAGTKVDYVALLDAVGDYWNPEGDTGATIRSLMSHLTALREAVNPDFLVFIRDHWPHLYTAIDALTHTDQGEER